MTLRRRVNVEPLLTLSGMVGIAVGTFGPNHEPLLLVVGAFVLGLPKVLQAHNDENPGRDGT